MGTMGYHGPNLGLPLDFLTHLLLSSLSILFLLDLVGLDWLKTTPKDKSSVALFWQPKNGGPISHCYPEASIAPSPLGLSLCKLSAVRLSDLRPRWDKWGQCLLITGVN